MNFTVLYSSDAEALLADFWITGPDRNDITWAQDKIDSLLATNPFQGIEIREGLFGLIVPPLKVYFEIYQEDRTVKVTSVGKLK